MTTIEEQATSNPDAVAAPEGKETKKSEPRPYVVLRRLTPDSPGAVPTFTLLRTIDAHSAEQAVREAATVLFAAGEEPPVTLVAVTANRFNPRTVSAKPRDPQLVLS